MSDLSPAHPTAAELDDRSADVAFYGADLPAGQAQLGEQGIVISF